MVNGIIDKNQYFLMQKNEIKFKENLTVKQKPTFENFQFFFE